jgi:hypothetical protein
MAVTARWYTKCALEFMGGAIDWTVTSFRVALHTSTYSPDIDTDTVQNTLGNEVAAGGGYTTGGEALTTVAEAIVQDGSATAWSGTTAYLVGDVVRPVSANGNLFRCIIAGSSAAGEPTWTNAATVGLDIVDSTVTWENIGTSFIKLDGTDLSWTPSTTITARYAVIYVDAGDGSDFLVGLVDFGQDESSVNGDFDINWHADGILQAFISL